MFDSMCNSVGDSTGLPGPSSERHGSRVHLNNSLQGQYGLRQPSWEPGHPLASDRPGSRDEIRVPSGRSPGSRPPGHRTLDIASTELPPTEPPNWLTKLSPGPPCRPVGSLSLADQGPEVGSRDDASLVLDTMHGQERTEPRQRRW